MYTILFHIFSYIVHDMNIELMVYSLLYKVAMIQILAHSGYRVECRFGWIVVKRLRDEYQDPSQTRLVNTSATLLLSAVCGVAFDHFFPFFFYVKKTCLILQFPIKIFFHMHSPFVHIDPTHCILHCYFYYIL